MQKQYEAIVAQNRSLQSELRLANKIIELMIKDSSLPEDWNNNYKAWKEEAIKKLGE